LKSANVREPRIGEKLLWRTIFAVRESKMRNRCLLCGMTAVTTASSEPRAAPKRRTLKNIGQGIDYSEEKQGMAMMAQR